VVPRHCRTEYIPTFSGRLLVVPRLARTLLSIVDFILGRYISGRAFRIGYLLRPFFSDLLKVIFVIYRGLYNSYYITLFI